MPCRIVCRGWTLRATLFNPSTKVGMRPRGMPPHYSTGDATKLTSRKVARLAGAAKPSSIGAQTFSSERDWNKPR